MKKFLITPVLATVLLAGACAQDGDGPTEVDTRPSVRFFNATTGMTGSGGFLANGQFANGSAIGVNQSAQTCSRVAAGVTTFGFGATNTGGTGLNGNPLATLNNQTIIDGGTYTVAAVGSAANPMVFMLDNNFSGTLASNQAAVRFVNAAPGTGEPANTFVFWQGDVGGNSPFAVNIAAGVPTPYLTVTSGANTFSVLKMPGHVIALESIAMTLQAGSVNTIAVVPATADGFQLINIPRC